MQVFVRYAGQFGQVAANEAPLGIEFLRLEDGVENPKVRLCIAPCRGGPLPAAVVGGQVIVVQVLGKKALAPAPVNSQVLGQKTGHHHAQAVVHIARLQQLPHGRIYQGVARAGCAPGLPQVGGLVPWHVVVFGLEGVGDHLGVVVQNHEIKITPGQFSQPGLRPLAAGRRLLGRQCGQLADGNGAKAQMHRQIRDPFAPRKIAGLVVSVQARQKVLQQLLGPAHASGQCQGGQVGGRKAQCF